MSGMNGCWNTQRKDGYYVLARKFFPGSQEFLLVPQFIKDVMSKDCRYDYRASDPKCEGCRK